METVQPDGMDVLGMRVVILSYYCKVSGTRARFVLLLHSSLANHMCGGGAGHQTYDKLDASKSIGQEASA